MNKQDIKLLLDTEDPVILEIGANNGSDTRQFLETFELGLFYCFEPDPRAWAKLNEIKDERCIKFNYAISDKDGYAKFHQSSGRPPGKQFDGIDWDLSGSLRTPKNHIKVHPWCKFDKQITVQTMRLDTWADDFEIDMIDFIWCDTQGAEIDVIKGGHNTITKRTRYLYTEYEDQEMYEGQINLKQILKMLPGFDLYKDFGTDALLVNTRFV